MSELRGLAELEVEKRNDARARADRAQAAEEARVSAEAQEERLAFGREQSFMRSCPTEEAQSQAKVVINSAVRWPSRIEWLIP